MKNATRSNEEDQFVNNIVYFRRRNAARIRHKFVQLKIVQICNNMFNRIIERINYIEIYF